MMGPIYFTFRNLNDGLKMKHKRCQAKRVGLFFGPQYQVAIVTSFALEDHLVIPLLPRRSECQNQFSQYNRSRPYFWKTNFIGLKKKISGGLIIWWNMNEGGTRKIIYVLRSRCFRNFQPGRTL